MVVPIVGKDYIAWVQRSLNRVLLDCNLLSLGDDTLEYRDKVRELQAGYGLDENGKVDVPEQNILIKANHSNYDYIDWAQTALAKAGFPPSAGKTGAMDASTRTAIKAFQGDAFKGEGKDGWIGSKTETALIAKSGTFPPGHIATPVKPVKPVKPVDPPKIYTGLTVSPHVPCLLQRGPTCWAAAFAMMYCWKHELKSTSEAMEAAGASWKSKFNRGLPLSEDETERLGRKLGLTGTSEVPQDWLRTLRDYGPVMLVQDPGLENWLHWIVVVGYRQGTAFEDRAQDTEELKYNEPGNSTSRLAAVKSVVESAKSRDVNYRCYMF